MDFSVSPFIAIWEITRACDLKCVHCRAEAIPNRDPRELTWEQGTKLIDDVSAFGEKPPLLVFTGGDPAKHPDICKYIKYADSKGLRVAVTPSATPLLTREKINEMKAAGLTRMAISIDGSTEKIHDSFRKQPGSYAHTMRALKDALDAGLTIQVNTTISRWNINDIDNLCALMRKLGLTLWAVFFLVPTGRGEEGDQISPDQFEKVFNKLYDLQQSGEFDIKTTAAPHYRRVVIERSRITGRAEDSVRFVPPDRRSASRSVAPTLDELAEQSRPPRGEKGDVPAWVHPGAWTQGDGIGRAARGVNDANGFVFIDHIGDVHPSGFMPWAAGNVKKQSLIEIYRNSERFKLLRDYKQLKGKCRMCEYRDMCGGARSRSFSITGDPMASEPNCVHVPEKLWGEKVNWLDPNMLVADMTPYIQKYGDV
ncbi:MAG: radical SAM protein [Planctomycetes bacterium]|nr:radical SAM protein [Planctomycetota bacterium]